MQETNNQNTSDSSIWSYTNTTLAHYNAKIETIDIETVRNARKTSSENM